MLAPLGGLCTSPPIYRPLSAGNPTLRGAPRRRSAVVPRSRLFSLRAQGVQATAQRQPEGAAVDAAQGRHRADREEVGRHVTGAYWDVAGVATPPRSAEASAVVGAIPAPIATVLAGGARAVGCGTMPPGSARSLGALAVFLSATVCIRNSIARVLCPPKSSERTT